MASASCGSPAGVPVPAFNARVLLASLDPLWRAGDASKAAHRGLRNTGIGPRHETDRALPPRMSHGSGPPVLGGWASLCREFGHLD